MPHHLKLVCLVSLIALIVTQLSLMLWIENDYRWMIALALTLPLLLPLKGLFQDRRYTYKWTGFLTLLYFCIGISEAFANPAHRVYSVLTILFSIALYLGSMYYSRYLRVIESRESAES